MTYHLAIDIGASSGRHILGFLQNDKMTLEEIYRFENNIVKKDGTLCWDLELLFNEIKNGLKKCKELNKIPTTIGIDTWGVDFVLLDEEDNIVGDTVCYRDSRTIGMEEKVFKIVPKEELYKSTGIQVMNFNTIFQLMSIKELQNKAVNMLLIPDYFNFLLTGVKRMEYTNMTTTGLINAKEKNWDYHIIEKLGLNKKLFKEPSIPLTEVGDLSPEIVEEIGFNAKVILPATHDTGSAVAALPTNKECVYISSGTWSLMGVELIEPLTSNLSMQLNFSNEGGINYRYRYLKNIMGLWMIQCLQKEWEEKLSFQQIADLASKSNFVSIVDCNDNRFLAPKNMIKEVQKACSETGQPIPEDIGDIATVIYNSLAKCYGDTIKKIEELTGKEYKNIHIIGGGSNAVYLNKLTEKYTNKKVYAGPSEATAVGNILAQMIYDKEFDTLESGRECVKRSFST